MDIKDIVDLLENHIKDYQQAVIDSRSEDDVHLSKVKGKIEGLEMAVSILKENEAFQIWDLISSKNQKLILNNVFCHECGLTRVIDYSMEKIGNDIVIRGKCSKCGNLVARHVEGED